MYDQIEIIGNLGKDPEARVFQNGDPVTSFNVAVNRSVKNKAGEWEKIALWYRVSVFGSDAERCAAALHKGSKVLVKGQLQFDHKTGGPRTYTRQDGTVGTSFEVTASLVRFLDAKSE
jgi:single-strand DNA-binding protein